MHCQKFFHILLFVISTFFFILPVDSHAGNKRPVAVLKSNVYDFGIAYEGNVVTHEFVVKNTGNANLEILGVSSG